VDGPKWTNTHECNDGCTKHDTFFFHCVLCSPSNLLFIVQDSKLVPTLPKLRFIQLNGLQMGNGMVHSRKFSSVQFSSHKLIDGAIMQRISGSSPSSPFQCLVITYLVLATTYLPSLEKDDSHQHSTIQIFLAL
jgi:hypothetical protein